MGCVTARTDTVANTRSDGNRTRRTRVVPSKILPYPTAIIHRFESMTAEPSHYPTIAEVSDKFRPAARYIPESYLFPLGNMHLY